MNGYKVIRHTSIEGLEKQVVELLQQGWNPSGNLVIQENIQHNAIVYYQPMVYYWDDEIPAEEKRQVTEEELLKLAGLTKDEAIQLPLPGFQECRES